MQRTKQGERPAEKSVLKRVGCRTESNALREVDRSKNRPRTRLEFVKPIRNGLRKKQI